VKACCSLEAEDAGNGVFKLEKIQMTRQEVAFSEECRRIKGCGSLKVDFYTRFKPENKGFWAVTWWKKEKGFAFYANSFF